MPTVKRQTRKKLTTKRKSSQTDVIDRVIGLEDLPEEGIKLCVYGRSASGKTRFMSTFAKKGPLLHLICSSNGMNEARSIRGVKNIKCVEIQRPNDLGDMIDYAEDEGFVTIALDHVTGFADNVLADIMGLERLPEQSSWGMAQREQYAQMGLQVKTYLRELLDLDCNVILLGQERIFNSTEEAGDLLMPYVSVAATPSVAGWIAPAVDYLCNTFTRKEIKTTTKKVGDKTITKKVETGKVEYCLRVGPDATYMTKFRVPPGTELPDVIVDPSYTKISHLIEGS